MQFKTSTSIALKFTGYVSSILLFFGIGINITSFGRRYQDETNRVNINNPLQDLDKNNNNSPDKIRGKFGKRKEDIITVPFESILIQELEEKKIFGQISKIDDIYIIYNHNNNKIKMSNISHFIDMQRDLIMTTLLVTLLGGILTFILSRNFVKSSLKDINKLVNYVQDIDIHNLHTPVPLSGPEDDEIRIIAQTLQTSLDTIKTQTDSLKDFVSYASHELKTPMSTIRGVVDLAEKTGKYTELSPKIKKTLTEMTTLLDTLLLITKREFQSIQKQTIEITNLVRESIKEVGDQYKEKNIIFTEILPNEYYANGQHDIAKIIINNIIKNAYKFTPKKGGITVILKGKELSLHNTGSRISTEDQEKIRTRFWKKGSTEQTGYGLGLYMVKLLVEKLGRSIQVQSQENEGTTFTITMK